MASMAIQISFTTPTETRDARVIASVPSRKGDFAYAYNHELSTEQNAEAAARSALVDLGWEGEFVLAELGCSRYVATLIPERYVKARDAVIAIRKAMSAGDLHGNPHSKQWGQQITDLTDGCQKGGFSREYAQLVLGAGASK